MAKGGSTRAVLILMLIGIGGAGALAWYVKTEPGAARVADLSPSDGGPRVKAEKPTPAHTPDQDTSKPASGLHVVIPVIQDGKLTSETTATEVPDGKDPKVFLTEEILKAVKVDGARVLGVDVRNGTAVINFGSGIDSGMGSDQEGLFLSALQKAFSQFPDVKNLELDMEGQKLESIGGHIDLTDGLPVTGPAAPPSDPKPSGP